MYPPNLSLPRVLNQGILSFSKLWLAISFVLFTINYSYSQIAAEHALADGTLNGSFDLDLSDIDNDGDLDVIFIILNESKLGWFENLGNGNFAPIEIISNGGLSAPQSLVIGDLNGDGFPDILVTAVSNTTGWYASLGNGNFSPKNALPYTASTNLSRAGIGDFDNDGDNDLVLYANGTDALFFSENLGGGNFASEVLIADNVPTYTRAIAVADYDNDSLLDFAFVADQEVTIGWLKNLTGTTFGPIQLATNTPYDPNDLKAIDVDYDGDMDLVFTSGGLGGIAWLENFGNGSFSTENVIGLSSVPRTFGMGHMDDDGYIDFFTSSASPTSNATLCFQNLQNGTWSQPDGFGSPYGEALAMSVGDMDGDGDHDVVVLTLNSIRWYENYLIPPNILQGKIFHDENSNGVPDPNESGLIVGSAIMTPGAYAVYPNSQGEYLFSSNPGTYTIEHQGVLPSSSWTLTTDNMYPVTCALNDPPIDTLNFGYSISSIQTTIDGSVTGSLPVCDTENKYWIDLWNLGTTKPSGIIQVELDDSTTFLSASVTPDSIVGNTVFWHFNDLDYFNHEMISYYLSMPSFLSMGDTLVTTVSFIIEDSLGNTIPTYVHNYEEVLLCAYDPNDKRVSPAGFGNQGFIPIVPELEYTVRFQNTGNYLATNVMITDTLDPNLDWFSLRFLGASHPVDITLDSLGTAKFKFNNINLPDSASNEPESHGYIKFSIDLKAGLVPGDEIRNQANIYFDFNPPIITNETLNTIQEEWENSEDGTQLLIFPNPSDGKFEVLVMNNTSEVSSLKVADVSGRIVFEQSNIVDDFVSVDLTPLNNGMYVVFLYDENRRILSSERFLKVDL